MWTLWVKKRAQSATFGPSESEPKPGLRHILTSWWKRQKTYTKAIIATSVTFFVAFGTFISSVADGLSVWDRFSGKAQQPAGADTSSTRASGPRVVPLPTCFTCTTGKTFPEQVSPRGTGARTFRHPLAFGDEGQRVDPGQQVEVVCRYHQFHADLSVQPGWWYLIASSPWNRQYYSPANSYLNGDPPEGPYLIDVDSGIPVC